MNTFKKLSFLFFALILSANIYAQNDDVFIHTVSKGQTLYSLAKMYETSEQAIIALNPGCEKMLSIGQKLKIPQKSNASVKNKEDNFIYHTIVKGETIYSLSKKYELTTLDICAVNPGLNTSRIQIGEVIRIPRIEKPVVVATNKKGESVEYKIRKTHKVKKGETVYSLCYIYGITKEEFYAVNPGIKGNELPKGKKLNIPYHIEPVKQSDGGYEQGEMDKNDPKYRFINHVFPQSPKIAVILPFMLDRYDKDRQMKMVEFYEGFLLSVKEQKEKGHSYEIITLDSGDDKCSLDSIIKSGTLDDVNLIIGAGFKKHNKELADFAKEKGIHLVIPFTNKEDEIYNNPMVYVVNSQQSYIIHEIVEQFAKAFPNANPIIINDGKNDRKEIVDALKADFEKRGVEYSTINIEDFTNTEKGKYIETISGLIKEDKQNIIIPSSKDENTLSQILPIVVSVRNLEVAPIENISLFGYPEWHWYASKLGDMLYKADTYFYTTSFSHSSTPEVEELHKKYLYWYNRNMQNNIPRFGILGYDLGNYFLSAISTLGRMPEGIEELDFKPIQSDFKFERVNNWGGLLNKKIFIIHFTPDYYIEKIDLDKQAL